MLRVPASSQLLGGSSAPQTVPLGGVAGVRGARPSAVLVQASASRKRRAAKRNGDHARTDGVRTTAGKGFGNADSGSLNSASASDRHKPSAPRFARDEQGSTASLAQHIGKAGQELQQQKQQGQQEGRSKDDQSYLDQHDASAENIEHQLQQIEATMQQTEQQAKQALEEAARPPSVSDVPKPKRPTRDDVKAAQPEYVVFSKGLGFSKSSSDTPSPIDSTEELHKLNSPTYASQEDARRVQMSDPEHPPSNSSAAHRRGSKEEAHEKLVHAEQVPQPHMGPAGAGIGAVELHGKQQVFTGPQGSNTQDGDGGLSGQQRTETSKDGTAAMGSQPAPPAGGLQGEELQGKGDQQRYAALEMEAGETAAPSSGKGSSEQREHASAHDVAVGAVDKVEAAVKSAAGATKHGVEVVAHEAGDAAVAGLNKLGEVGGRVADKVQPVLADAKAAVTGEARHQDRSSDRSSSDRSSGRSGEGASHLLNISSVIDRTAQAADRLAARASSGRSGGAEQAPKAEADGPVWVGEAHYDGSASSAGSQGGAAKADNAAGDAGNLDQQLKEAEAARGKVTEAVRRAKERLSQLRSQGAQSAGTGSAMPPAGAALAGGPVGGSTGSNANVDAEIQKLEADLDEALTVLDQLDDAVERVKSKQADGSKSGSSSGLGSSSAFSAGGSGKAASSREAEMARLGGGAGGGGSSGGSGGGGGSGGRGGSGGSGRGGQGAGGEGGGLPEWVVPAFGVALAFAAYKATIGKKKEPEPEEQIEQGVAAAKAKAKQQAKLQAEKAKAAAEKAKQAGASALETAKSKAHDAKGRALNAKEEVKSKALSATEDIKSKALSTKEKAAEKAGQLKEKATEAASGAIDTIKREGGRKDTWLAALGVVVGLGLIFGSGGGNGGDGNGIDERGYAKENEAWRGKAKKGQQVGDNVSGDIGGVSTVAPLDSTYVDYADTYKRGLAAGDAAVAPGPVDDE